VESGQSSDIFLSSSIRNFGDLVFGFNFILNIVEDYRTNVVAMIYTCIPACGILGGKFSFSKKRFTGRNVDSQQEVTSSLPSANVFHPGKVTTTPFRTSTSGCKRCSHRCKKFM